MNLTYAYAIGFIAAALLAFEVLTKRFDPFAPVWLFLVGYVQVYVLQATTLHEWAVHVRGTRDRDGGELPGILGAVVVRDGLLLRASEVVRALFALAAARVVDAGGVIADARADRGRLHVYNSDDED